jgi:hypothetical protein
MCYTVAQPVSVDPNAAATGAGPIPPPPPPASDVDTAPSKVGVSRRTVHAWLARYEVEGPLGAQPFGRVVRSRYESILAKPRTFVPGK